MKSKSIWKEKTFSLSPFKIQLALMGTLLWILLTLPFLYYYWDYPLWKLWGLARLHHSILMERIRFHQLLAQPVNTLTNIFFLPPAFIILFTSLSPICDKKSLTSPPYSTTLPSTSRKWVQWFSWFSLTLGLTTIFVFGASLFFHSSFSVLGDRLDHTAVLALAWIPFFYAHFRLYCFTSPLNKDFQKKYLLFFPLLFLFQILSFWIVQKIRITKILAILVFYTLFLEWRIRKIRDAGNMEKEKKKALSYYFGGAFLSLFLGAFFWIGDVRKWMGSPNSLFQAHSLWHLFAALSILCLYLFYREEFLLFLDSLDPGDSRKE